MDNFDYNNFTLYNVQAPSYATGLNVGNFFLPSKTAAGIPTGNSFPYVFVFTAGTTILPTGTLAAGNWYLPLSNIEDGTTTKQIRNYDDGFTGVQFDYPRSININVTEDCTALISYLDVNNYKATYAVSLVTGNNAIEVGINILNSILVTTTETTTDVTVNLGNKLELPYVDYFAPATATQSYTIEMISLENDSSNPFSLESCLLISTQTNTDPYPMGLAPTSILPTEQNFSRPLINLTELVADIPNGSTVCVWQTVYPAFSMEALKNSKGGGDNTILNLEGAYQTGEAVYGSIPNSSNWIGWNG
jgi:hypothetical protein